MTDCECDLWNILDEETFNVRVIRELCNISNNVGSTELIRMVDQTDDGDVQFIRTSNGDFELDGETSYTPVGNVVLYKRNTTPSYTELPFCYFYNSPVLTDIYSSANWSRVELKVSYTGTSNSQWIIGSRVSAGSENSRRFSLVAEYDNTRFAWYVGNTGTPLYQVVNHLDYATEFTIEEQNYTAVNDGVTLNNTYNAFVDGTYPIAIGAINTAGTVSSTESTSFEGYFYYFKTYEGATLTHDIVPVKDSNNVICLYDKVTEQFYYTIRYSLSEYMPIPAQYTEGDYLNMPTTSYINTGVGAVPTKTISEFTVSLNTQSSTRRLYGCRINTTTTAYNIFSAVSSYGPRWDILCNPTTGSNQKNLWTTDIWYHVITSYNESGYSTVNVNDEWFYTGTLLPDATELNYIVVNSMLDITTNTVGTGSDAKWKDVIISKWGTEPTAYLKPVYDNTNSEAGYFDVMRGVFLGNAGTGTITLGTINSLLLSPNLSLGNISLKPSAGLMSTLSITDEEEEEDRPANLREPVRPLQEQVVEEIE